MRRKCDMHPATKCDWKIDKINTKYFFKTIEEWKLTSWATWQELINAKSNFRTYDWSTSATLNKKIPQVIFLLLFVVNALQPVLLLIIL